MGFSHFKITLCPSVVGAIFINIQQQVKLVLLLGINCLSSCVYHSTMSGSFLSRIPAVAFMGFCHESQWTPGPEGVDLAAVFAVQTQPDVVHADMVHSHVSFFGGV